VHRLHRLRQDLPEEVLHARGHGGLSAAPALLGGVHAAAQARRAQRDDEVEDLVSLLRAHADPAAGHADEADAVALAIAVASLGDNHLWQDLGLASRAELSALMRHWFPALVAKNAGDMKWKKFLYRQLCEREQVLICKSPSCAVCVDQALCFGPES
jgi:nitrogen fixation protein NifQ